MAGALQRLQVDARATAPAHASPARRRFDKLLRQLDPFGAGDAHLGAAMHFHLRRNLPGQLRDSHILHDDRIRAGGGNLT